MLKFDNDSIYTGHIKQLLNEFNLPSCPVYKQGMKVFKDHIYIVDGYIAKALETKVPTNIESFKKYDLYIYNKPYLNITKNFPINNLLYDTETHKYLGEYLRFIRDYHNVDLMSMYNCYANEFIKNVTIATSSIKTDSDNVVIGYKINFDTTSDKFKILGVPVKFGHKYTIGIDCDTRVEILAGFYKNNSLVNGVKDIESFYSNTYYQLSGTRFKKPFVYDKLYKLDVTDELYDYEKVLYLFIKVPTSCESSITVIEGDVSGNCQSYINNDGLSCLNNCVVNYENSEYLKNRKYYSNLQLFNLNAKISYPFADRLLEYLSRNVICPLDETSDDIKRLQKRLVQRYNSEHKIGLPYLKGNLGIWDDTLRSISYDIVRQSSINLSKNLNKFDTLGYVDKDCEQLIGDYVDGGSK